MIKHKPIPTFENFEKKLYEGRAPRGFTDSSWKSAITAASGDISAIRSLCDSMLPELKSEFPQIVWSVEEDCYSYNSVYFGCVIMLEAKGKFPIPFIRIIANYEGIDQYDIKSVGKLKDYEAQVYYYPKGDNNPTETKRYSSMPTKSDIESLTKDRKKELPKAQLFTI